MLEPSRDQLEIFVDALFRHAGKEGFVSPRAFYEDDSAKPFRINPASLVGGLRFLVDVAEDDARRAAGAPKSVVFCPPLAVFSNKDRAREIDIAEGLALSVECDEHPLEAIMKLEEILGRATIVVASGGKWTDPKTGQIYDKRHLHWRLASPARGAVLAKLKQARDIATRLVGGDPSNKPVCHPIRWPGSWHRKSKPRLCEIETHNPDREINLDAALDALTAAAPADATKAANGKGNSQQTAGAGTASDWTELVQGIVTGSNYHGALASLAAKYLAAGMSDGAAVNMLRALMESSACPHDGRWATRYADIPRAVLTAREKIPEANRGNDQTGKSQELHKPLLHAYLPRPFFEIPRRQWLHAGHYIRQQVVMTVAPGGYGKTTLLIANSIEMCIGQGLIGPAPPNGPLRVAYWNAEDPEEEIERRIAAACLHHKIEPEALRGRLFLGSKITGRRRLASLDKSGNVVFDDGLLTEVTRFISDNHIDCAIFDPLISFHRVPEGSNNAMEEVIKEAFEPIALACNCCIELSQHTRKGASGQQGEINVDDSRGAGAITNATRSVRILNRMTVQEAVLPKIEPEERRHYLRVSRDKTKLAPPGKATWFHLASVELPNGDGHCPGDHIQTAEAWDYPEPFAGVTADDIRWMRETVRAGKYRTSPRSPDWVGLPLLEHLELNPDDKGDARRSMPSSRPGSTTACWQPKPAKTTGVTQRGSLSPNDPDN
jgi:AAA domain